MSSSCAPPPPAPPRETRALNQQRAIELAAEAVAGERFEPAPGRVLQLPRERSLKLDLGVTGQKFGIAFITGEERAELGSAIPAHDVGSDALTVVTLVDGTRVLLLHDLAYENDEQRGERRELSSVVVERRLQRDVRDFLAQAVRQGWP